MATISNDKHMIRNLFEKKTPSSKSSKHEDYVESVRSEYNVFFRKVFQMLNFNGISGDYCEFGCHGARTFTTAHAALHAATHAVDRHLWAFDSFLGLPESSLAEDEHPMWKAGTYKTGKDDFIRRCVEKGIPRDHFTVVPGFYEETLGKDRPADLKLPTDVAFAFIDCDMYSSTQSVLGFIEPMLKNGMVIALDDYFCYSAERPSGERLALLEMFNEDSRFKLLPYANFHWAGTSFIVEGA